MFYITEAVSEQLYQMEHKIHILKGRSKKAVLDQGAKYVLPVTQLKVQYIEPYNCNKHKGPDTLIKLLTVTLPL